jgi:hypothetical protein
LKIPAAGAQSFLRFGVKVTEKRPLFPQAKKKCIETYRFNALLLVAGTGLEPATSGL